MLSYLSDILKITRFHTFLTITRDFILTSLRKNTEDVLLFLLQKAFFAVFAPIQPKMPIIFTIWANNCLQIFIPARVRELVRLSS